MTILQSKVSRRNVNRREVATDPTAERREPKDADKCWHPGLHKNRAAGAHDDLSVGDKSL